ncbi:hypothetical protein [Metabacillus niabensis]|uniref:Uncharacterized protein n=1 Tax=Metabacillus niabensis TaxID=324854 RepID=A0ABT9YWN9_9BACI|nr:hypothetical protein [Metabacillus niabensis]MDQ0224411.1 hypothetical protein [Metabacillus niabensis]
MVELEIAKSCILEQIYSQLEDDLKHGIKAERYWLEVLNKEYLESFAYFEILKASHQINDDVEFSKFVRGILEFVNLKRNEILFER